MRPLRLLILLLVLTTAILVALAKPLAGDATIATKKLTRKHVQRHAATHRQHRAKHYMHPLNERVVNYARKFIGTPYVWGGSSPHPGFDCSGLVSYVYKHFGISLPHSTYGQVQRGRRVLRKYLQPGDLVFFANNSHVGLYIGGNRLLDAPHSGARVHIVRMTDWYSYSYDASRRLVSAG